MNAKLRYWIPLAIVTTLFAGMTFHVGQQAIRLSANDPQTQIAEDSAIQLANLKTPPSLPPLKVDMVKSLSPYVILYNDKGQPVLGTAQLDGKIPTVAPGVLDYVRQHDKNSVTWEPRKGVRQAIVIVRVNGANKGFVLAGRSLREVEQRTGRMLVQVVFVWLITLFLSLVAIFIFIPGPPKSVAKKK